MSFIFGDHVLRQNFVIVSISETLRLVTLFLPFYVKTQYCLLIRVYLIIFLPKEIAFLPYLIC